MLNKTAIVIGLAHIPYDGGKGCWVLPEGANQANRYVESYAKALEYAKEMNKLMMEQRQ